MILKVAISVLLAVYVLRFLWTCRILPGWLRLVLSPVLLAGSQIYLVNGLVFGSVTGPDTPFPLLVAQLFLFAALLPLVGLAMLRDGWRAFCLLAARLRGGKADAPPKADRGRIGSTEPERNQAELSERAERADRTGGAGDAPAADLSRRDFLKAGAVLAVLPTALGTGCALVSALAAGVGVARAVARPELHAWRLALAHPASGRLARPLRLVHVADMHLGPLWSLADMASLVATINALEPDLVCITGDLANGKPSMRLADGQPRLRAAGLLGELCSTYGTFACTGNHEYYDNGREYDAWMAVWRTCGITFLHNETRLLELAGMPVVLAGLDDPWARLIGHREFLDSPGRDLPTLFRNVPPGDEALRIVLDHRPKYAGEAAAAGAHLQLSGHTHGGQCPGVQQLVWLTGRGYVRGWYDVCGMPLFVTTGAGLWPGLGLRLGVPAEIVLLELTALRPDTPQAGNWQVGRLS